MSSIDSPTAVPAASAVAHAASSPNQPVLEIRDLRASFTGEHGPIDAVRGIDLDLAAGQTFVLLGESGSGKSVTARAILGLYGRRATVRGSTLYRGRSLGDLDDGSRRALRGSEISLVPQDPANALDPLRRVGAQVAEVLRVHRTVDSKAAAKARVLDLLDRVGLHDPPRIARSYPHQLSGGEQQRVAIAAAIACEPAIILADEPTTALDVTVQAQVLRLFQELQRDLGTALLLITHDVGVAAEFDGQVGVMYGGRLVERGPLREVLAEPHHPYTAGLLGSLPTPGVARGGLRAIPGYPPAAGTAFPGCAFAARCALATPECDAAAPELVATGPGRTAACPVTAAIRGGRS